MGQKSRKKAVKAAKKLPSTSNIHPSSASEGSADVVFSPPILNDRFVSNNYAEGENKFKNIGQISSVKDLLATGLLEGEPITYTFKKYEVELRGFIKGNGYQCGCSSCNYNQILSALEFEKHAGATSHNQNNHICLENGKSLYEVVKYLEKVPPALLYVEVLNVTGLREKMKFRNSNELLKVQATHASVEKPSKYHAFTSVGDLAVEGRKEREIEPRSEESLLSSKGSKVSAKYNPRSLLSDVRGLLSTGLLEGFRVTYKKEEVEIEGIIRDLGYVCGCSVCNYTRVLSAVEFEKHTGVTTSNQNNHIFLNSGITLYNLVKKLKDSPLHLLGDLIGEKIGCPPNLKCFEEWKDSFQMVDDISNTKRSTEKVRLESHSEPHSVENAEGSVAEGIANLALKAGLTTKFEKAATECCMDPTSSDILNMKSSPRMATASSFSSLFSTNSMVAPSMAVAEGTHFPDSYLVTDGVQSKQKSSLMETASELKTRLPNFLESSAAPVQQETVAHAPQKKRDNALHRLIFEEGGLPDGTELTYRTKGEILLSGHKQGNNIVCHCHKGEFSPSQFEAHAGMGQRRQPKALLPCSYRNIYTSDGKTLHELCQILSRNTKVSAIGGEDPRLICSDGGEMVSCDGCRQHFPSAGMQLKHAPNGAQCCPDCFDQSQRALSSSSSNSVKPTNLRLRRTFQPEAEDDIYCTICKDGNAILQTQYDGRTITFCSQCGKAYHVGCYAQSHPGLKFKEAISDKLLCCTGCSAVCVALEKMPTEGKMALPDCSSSILKRNFEQRCLQNDTVAAVRWQLLNGKHTQDKSLLKAANKLFQGAFEPIYVGSSELIKQMVYAKGAREAGLTFHSTCCAVLIEKSVIISAAILRVHGQCTAELPLVVTRKECQGKGYFQTLLSVIERFLSDLQVKLLITSVDEHTQSVWINKFGFVKATHQELRMFRQHPILNFKDTTVLKKAIPDSSAERS